MFQRLMFALIVPIGLIATSSLAGQTIELDKLKQGLKKPSDKEKIDAIQKWNGPEADAVKAADLFIDALNSRNPQVQQAAVTALVKLGEKAALPVGEALKNPNAALRKHCLRVIDQLGPKGKPAAPAVAKLLLGPPDAVRGEAQRVLLAMGPAAVPAVVDLLRVNEKVAQEVLRQMGPAAAKEALPLVIELAKDKNVLTRRGVAGYLGTLGEAKAVLPVLAALIRDSDAEVRIRAAKGLVRFGQDAVPSLLEQLQVTEDRQQWPAITTLVLRIAPLQPTLPPGLVAVLAKHLEAKDVQVRTAALLSLQPHAVRSKELAGSVIPLLSDKDGNVRNLAASVLAPLNDKIIPILLKQLKDPSDDVRLTTVAYIQSRFPTKSREMVADLAPLLADKDARVRQATAELLRHSRSMESLWPLATVLADEKLEVRQAAVVSLQQLAFLPLPTNSPWKEKGLAAMTRAFADKEPQIRTGAMQFAKLIGKTGKPGLTLLVELTAHKELPVRLAAISVLSEIRPISKEVLVVLRKLREDPDERVRGVVMRVLIPLENPGAENLEFLVLALHDKDRQNRRAAGVQLARMRGPALPRLIELAEKGPDPAGRAEAIRALGLMGPFAAPAVKTLIDLVRSDKAENQPFRIYALAALDKMHPEGEAGLLGILVDADASAQVAVVEMLRPEQVKLAKDLLVDLLRSKNLEVRSASADALAKLGAGIAKELEPLLADKDADTRAAALQAAEGFATVETLAKFLQDDKLVVRETAGRALARKGPGAHAVLAEALRSKDYRAQIAAANAIILLDDRAEALLPGLIDIMVAKGARDLELQAVANAIVRINPVLGARQLAAKAGGAELLALLKRQPAEVRELACLALAEQGSAAGALPALTDLLKDPKTDVAVLAAAARAVNAISPRQKGQDEDSAHRLAPDLVARLVKGTHDRSTQLREEIMTSLQSKFSSQGKNSAETILAALHQGQITDEANHWLAHQADSVKMTDDTGPSYVRILALYHNGAKNAAARLSPAAEQALKEQFWRYLETRGASILPKPVAKIQVTLPTEQLPGYTTAYLALDVLKDDPLYKDRTLEGRSLKELHEGWTLWWREWARERAILGLWPDMGWPAHQIILWPCLLNMHECASDPLVKQRFKMLLDLTAIEEEQISIQGVRAGRKGKKDAVGCGIDPWKDVLQGEQPRRLGEASADLSGIVWTSSYQLPPAAILLRKLNRPVPYYLIGNRQFFGGCVFGYATPHYLLGCQFAQAEGTVAGTMEAFGTWHRLIFDDMKAIYFPLSSGERRHVQHQNIYIATWDANRRERQSIRFSADLKSSVRGDWLFLSNGPAFAGIYVEGGFVFEKAGDNADPKAPVPPACDSIILKDARALVLLHAGDVHKFGSFEKFQEAILQAPLVLTKTSLQYSGPQTDAIEFFRDRTKTPVIAGATPAKNKMIYDSPYLQCMSGQAQVTVRVGPYVAVYDFDNSVIKEGTTK